MDTRTVTVHGEDLEGRNIVHLMVKPDETLCGLGLPSQASPDEEPGWELSEVTVNSLVCGACVLRDVGE
jgi:hypothetical protein